MIPQRQARVFTLIMRPTSLARTSTLFLTRNPCLENRFSASQTRTLSPVVRVALAAATQGPVTGLYPC